MSSDVIKYLEMNMGWKKKAISFVFICIISCFLSMATLASPPIMEGWKQNDTGWWYGKSDGTYPSTSWKKINNKWYYFDDNGYMVEDSWVNNYYVGNDGAMLVSTVTPDGYHVLENGERVEENIGPVASYTKDNEVGPGGENNNSQIGPEADNNSGNEIGSGSDNITTDTNDQLVTGSTVLIPNYTTTEKPNSGADIVDKLQSYGLSEEEANLYYLINEYRESLGLSKLSFSKSLTKVARAHVKDSHDYTPRLQLDNRGIQGNLHSWSKYGNWSGGAYTSDHEYAEIMWNKPKELTSYQGSGYEISVYHSIGIDPQLALDLWIGSTAHNNVIIGNNDWSFITTMGVAMDKNYSHVWFGGDEDPEGYYDIDGYEVVHP